MNNVINLIYVLEMKPDFFETASIDSRIDIDVLTATIISRCGTLLPLHSNIDVFKILSDNWFKRKSYNISKMLDTLEYDYNPIENYNRSDLVHENVNTSNESNTETDYGSVVESNGNNKESNENTVSAYNTFTYQPNKKDEIQSNYNQKQNQNDSQSIIKNDKYNKNNWIVTTSKGNIGITTTQKMIASEREINIFNIYEWISLMYEAEFFICIS